MILSSRIVFYACNVAMCRVRSASKTAPGYSFYTAEAAIEKCVTVSFSISVQPVAAFVGGVQFELMPKPLASVDTTVCWPTGVLTART